MEGETVGTRYCAQCGLPLGRCPELGGEDWPKLWDETVPGIADSIGHALRETMEGR